MFHRSTYITDMITYNEAYNRWQLLSEALELDLPAPALVEVLRVRNAYLDPVDEYNSIRPSVVPEEREKEAQRPCGVTDRRLSVDTVTAIAAAAITAGSVVTAYGDGSSRLEAKRWLIIFTTHLAPL